MYDCTGCDAVARMNQVHSQLSALMFRSPANEDFTASFSAGVVCFPDDCLDLQALYRSADTALNRARTTGRRRMVYLQEDAVGG